MHRLLLLFHRFHVDDSLSFRSVNTRRQRGISSSFVVSELRLLARRNATAFVNIADEFLGFDQALQLPAERSNARKSRSKAGLAIMMKTSSPSFRSKGSEGIITPPENLPLIVFCVWPAWSAATSR